MKAWSTGKTVVIIGVLIALALVVGGLAHLVSPGNAPLGGLTPVTQPSVTCTFGQTGADVEVQFTNDAEPCGTQESLLATNGESWYTLSQLTMPGSPGPADGETEQVVCILTKNGSTVTVEDAGMLDYGTEICSGNEQGGWESS